MNRTARNQLDRLRLLPTDAEFRAWQSRQTDRRRRINAARDNRYAMTDRLLDTRPMEDNTDEPERNTDRRCDSRLLRGDQVVRSGGVRLAEGGRDGGAGDGGATGGIVSRFLLALAWFAVVAIGYLAICGVAWWLGMNAGGAWRE